MSEVSFIQPLKLQEYSQLFKALGEEVRLKIIGLLEDRELCVCDFMEVLDMVQSTVSRHLAYLKNSGWVVGRREGKWMYYRLHPNVINNPIQLAIIEHISGLAEIQTLRKTLKTYLGQKDGTNRCS